MAKRVEGLSIDLDLNTQALNRGLKGAKDQLKTVNSEMKSNMSAFDRGDRSVEKYEKRLQGLNKKLQAQEKVTTEARKEYDRMVEQHGEGSKEAEKAAREYNNQAAALNNLDRYVNDATQELENMREEQDRANSKWGKMSSNLDNFSGQLDTAQGKMNEFGDTMSSRVTAPIVGMGALAVESTREFREQMARLETNAKDAGVGIDTTREAMRDLSGVSKETDSNVEALSNLLATDMNESQMQQTIDNLSGAIVKFPDTLKIESLADGLQETVATGKAVGPFAELLERMGVDLENFDKGLAESKESGDELNYTLNTLNDLDLSKMNREFRESNKELVEHREAQYDFQESFAELGEKLEPIATDITERVIEIVEAFNELEPATQDNIIKFAGLAAAVGPASKAISGLTKGVSGIIKTGSKFAGLLGKARGAGLLGRVAMLGMSGPVGLAVAGVGALGAGIYALTRNVEDTIDINFEHIESMQKQIDKTDSMIERFKELEKANRLSKDEMIEYMDNMDRIEESESEEEIANLRDRQSELLEKSKLTNKEMETFIELNDDIIEKAPDAAGAISDEGNAYAENLETLQKMTDEKREQLRLDTRTELVDALEKENELLNRQSELETTIENAEKRRAELQNQHFEVSKKVNQTELRITELQNKKNRLLEQGLGPGDAKVQQVQSELLIEQDNLMTQTYKKEELREQIEAQGQIISSKENDLKKTNTQLEKLDRLKADYEQIVLSEFDINAQKGEGLTKIQQQIEKLEQQKQKLKENSSQNYKMTDEYRNQVSDIDDQIQNLQGAKGQLQQINDLAAETAYEKDIYINASPSIHKFRSELTLPLGVDIEPQIKGLYEFRRKLTTPLMAPISPSINSPLYAEGTDYHPGGPAVVGEEGWELVRHGSQWSALNAGMYDLPKGTEVFPHQESKRMIDAMRNIPAYASGISAPGEADRIVNSLNNQQPLNGQPINLQLNITNAMDGREVGRVVEQHVTEIQQWNQEVEQRFE